MRLGQITNSQERIAAAERARQALELRKAGAQYADIATTLGYADASGAYRAVSRALAKLTAEPAAELRELELLRLDRMLQAIWDQVIRGNHGAVDRALRIGERRAKLLGLDAPQKIAPTSPSGEEEYGAAAERYRLRQIAAIFGGGAEATTDGLSERAAGGAGDGSSERPGVDSDQSLHQGQAPPDHPVGAQ
jgi:hypothetical protein